MPEGTEGASGAGIFGKVWARFGEVAKRLGIVHEHDVNEALEHQETTIPRKKLGEILVERGKMTGDHVEAVLKEQRAASVEAQAPAAEAPKPKEAAEEKAAPAGKPAAAKPAAKKAVKKAPKRAAGKAAKKAKRKPGGRPPKK